MMDNEFVKCKDGALILIPAEVVEFEDGSNSLRKGDSRERVRRTASTVLYFDEATYAWYVKLYGEGVSNG